MVRTLLNRAKGVFHHGSVPISDRTLCQYPRLSDQVVDAVLLPNVIKGADMGVVETGDGPGFALKAFPQVRSL